MLSKSANDQLAVIERQYDLSAAGTMLLPEQRVHVLRDHPKTGRVEFTGTIVDYFRNNAWHVREDEHGTVAAYYAKEITPA